MLSSTQFKKLALCSMTTAILAASQSGFAHTRLQTSTILENTRVYNNIVIGHGCGEAPVMGTSVVFPDSTATVTSKPVGAAKDVEPAAAGAVTDWLEGAGEGYAKKVYSKEVFSAEGQKTNPQTTNTVGFWTGGGALPAHNYVGLVPFKTDAIKIKSASCAKTVTFVVPVADVCKLTNVGGFSNETVNLWSPVVGSNFDGDLTEHTPATLKVVRNIEGAPATATTAKVDPNPLPADCGEGLDITITPTADQLNRDMPAIDNGVQVWPAQ
ncbi:hypothetical protein [Methylobacter sp. YRD-M1]|uniref:hypothetical protein n=1 Tax=Methylobacter sp. YRD-M1 TaxID=2911520 RepID=UPI00227D54BF|nr:hypothetical protein [Methylobacter sp. YRD-M1]WAK01467.1 hypothetical protein LZ558_16805 [Methylobacter sp. YRD-M1]